MIARGVQFHVPLMARHHTPRITRQVQVIRCATSAAREAGGPMSPAERLIEATTP